MNSVIVEGKVLDFKYKKLQDNHWAFYVGKILIGQVFKMKGGWTAVSNHTPNKLGAINGFKTRYSASQYMLLHCGLIK